MGSVAVLRVVVLMVVVPRVVVLMVVVLRVVVLRVAVLRVAVLRVVVLRDAVLWVAVLMACGTKGCGARGWVAVLQDVLRYCRMGCGFSGGGARYSLWAPSLQHFPRSTRVIKNGFAVPLVTVIMGFATSELVLQFIWEQHDF